MFCRICGKELDEDIKFCPDCGTKTESNGVKKEYVNVNGEKPKRGKGIASMVLGIIGAYFGLSILASASTYSGSGLAFAIGYVLIPIALSVPANCLAISERQNERNGFNTSGLILSYVTYGLSFLAFIIAA